MVKKELQESVADLERKLVLADDGRCQVIAEQMYEKGKENGRVSFPNDNENHVRHVLHLFQGK